MNKKKLTLSDSLINALSDQLKSIENYDPSKDYFSLFNNAESYFEKLAVIKKYYIDNEQKILSLASESLFKSFNIYSFDWVRFFTPIEMDAWQCIRCSGIILYPQYPLLNYALDFANPYLKIGLELDGKEFHNKEKDRIRDQRIYDETGWKIFRVTGSEANRILEMPDKYPHLYNEESINDISKFMHSTIDGVVLAIKEIFFLPNKEDKTERGLFFYDLCIKTLTEHKLANFNIL